MVEIIGLVTVGALVWLIAWSMANESEAERRRLSALAESRWSAVSVSSPERARQAA